MNVRPVFMLINQDPHALLAARERMELALTLAASDWPLTVAFADAGVLQLLPPVKDAPLKDFAAAWSSLALFGAEQVLVDEDSLKRFDIRPDQLRLKATVVDREGMSSHIATSELIL